jgi:geranyl-CoA carboxylase alpha subunit
MATNPPFRRVLIANRGEIALRITRGLRELGVESVAVHSDVDARCAHVLAADHAIALGGNTSAESYLDFGKILAAAKRTGAEAIHPGYGFLSENAAFARAVRDAGLVFVGPNPEAMDRLGGKKAAREEAIAAGVPVIPGTEKDTGDADLIAYGKQIGMPVMVKASAGGGGRGMRMVEREHDLAEALAAGRREAKASFGDDRMILERAVFPARHIEIQLIGDQHGHVVSLHERECSVQRRHQKVLEEAPSAVVGEELRQRMGAAAIALAKRVGYDNAGTAEFLLDPKGNFYFLEVNTRLQVEHPVTELVTGVDLVHLQLHVAATRSKRASAPSRRRPATSRPPACCAWCARPKARACASTAACTRAGRCRRTTTRCSPSSSSTRPIEPPPARGSARRCATWSTSASRPTSTS